jgi:hypothetical protein
LQEYEDLKAALGNPALLLEKEVYADGIKF